MRAAEWRAPVPVVESCTLMVNENVPAWVGVPLRTPVLGASVRPAGSVPRPATVVKFEYVGVPPLAVNVWM